jgi:hypothetical protein
VAERSLAQVLAALPAWERAQLEEQLSTASEALWRARQALSQPHAAVTSLATWRTDLRAVTQALAAADAAVAPNAPNDAPGR